MCKTIKCTDFNARGEYPVSLAVSLNGQQRPVRPASGGAAIWKSFHHCGRFSQALTVSAGKENDHVDLEWSKAMDAAFAVVENLGIDLTMPGREPLALRPYGVVEPRDSSSGRDRLIPWSAPAAVP